MGTGVRPEEAFGADRRDVDLERRMLVVRRAVAKASRAVRPDDRLSLGGAAEGWARVKMIDRTYGHLVAGADAYERELLDAFDHGPAGAVGRAVDAQEDEDAA